MKLRRALIAGALCVATACKPDTPQVARTTPPATTATRPPVATRAFSIVPLPSGAPCPRPRGRKLSKAFGLAFGPGPVYAVLSGEPQQTGVGLVRYGGGADDGTGHAVKVFWVWDGRYNGSVLIRGRRIDRPGTLRFNAEPPAYASGSELAFPAGRAVDPSGWHVWGSHMRFKSPGCYAVQIDGRGFSKTLRFEALP